MKPLSDIDQLFARYRAGTLPFDDLKTILSTRTYPTPERYRDKPTGAAERYQHASDTIGTTSGTWDDVIAARLRGDITPGQLLEITVASQANHPTAKRGTA